MSIVVRQVRKTYQKFVALDNVSVEIGGGELVALLGPSGSGKTTLLRVIAGLEIPDANTASVVTVNGQDILRGDMRQRKVGFVFQHYALFRHMTVYDNIAFGLTVRPRKERPPKEEICDRVRKLLQLIQLEGLADRFPSQLSGGQRQRVALARALAIEPSVLLLDEPFGALDAKVRQDLRRWLRRLHDELHVTTVLVTHDQEEALEVADRIILMNKAKIEQVGTPEDIFHRPASQFVMDFLGHVNLFHGRMDGDQWIVDSTPGAASARVYARPFQVDIQRTSQSRTTAKAKVQRILAAGPVVKVELTSESGDPILAEMAHDRFRELKLAVNEEVYVSLKEAQVFQEDYSI